MRDSIATALRLRLPCPCCDEIFSTTAYALIGEIALSCTRCGHGWVEPAQIDAALVRRAMEFCADAERTGALEPSSLIPQESPLVPSLPWSGPDS